MYDTQEIYLQRLEQYKRDTPPCPHCGSELTALKVIISERGLSPVNRTHTCLKCQKDFKLDPMADDPNIPF
jgi:formamidopyrimidine-DNA glycosylase